MALRTWAAPINGNWSVADNWTDDNIPQNGDDVVISFADDNITTTLNTFFSLNNFTTDEDFVISGSKLTVNSTGVLNANTTLSGATLTGNFTNNGNLSFIGPIVNALISGTINNQGTITQNTTTDLILPVGTINNQSGGTYEFQSGAISGINSPSDRFNNSGTLLKTTSATATMNVLFYNQPGGLIDVQAGTLIIRQGNSTGGNYAVAAGSVLNYGSHTFSGTHTGTGTGTINFAGGTKTFNNATFNFAPGLLQLNGLNATSTTLTGNLTNTGNLSIINPLSAVLSTGTLNNQGTITHTDGTFNFANGTINNQSGGTYDFQSGVIFPSSGTNSFNNSGTLLKTTNATATFNINFTNSGTVESQGGTLSFNNAYTQTGGTTILNGGTIAAASTIGFDLQGGSLSGNGTATGNVTNAGTIDPGLTGIGQINLTGNYTSTNTAEIDIELGGTSQGSGYDFFDILGSANLNGTLNVSLINGFTPTLGQVFEVVEYGSLIGGGTNLTFSNLEIAPGLALEATFDSNSLNLTVVESQLNDPPVVDNPIPDQNATENSPFSFQFAANTFSDPDAGDVLTYTYNDAEIPDWLSFDANTRTFSGTPGNNDAGTLNIEVTATDNDGAFVTDEFILTVADFVNPTTVSIAATTPTATEGGSNGVYTVSRDNTEGELTVNLAVNNNSTANQADYTLNGNNLGNTFSVTIADGQSSTAINLAAINDTLVESNESLILDLVANSNYQIDSNNNSATATILDNDGSNIDELIKGNQKPNDLDGRGGNDTLLGFGGDDTLRGGDGNDSLNGGPGNDLLLGGSGQDLVNGNLGNDILLGGDDNDKVNGGNDNDTLYGESGNDTLNGNQGNDVLRGGLGNDTLAGSGGSDIFIIAPGEGTDTINDFKLGQSDKIGLADGLTINDIYRSGNSIFAVADDEVLATLTGVNASSLSNTVFVEV
jgi:Ca2+-binding RTX toxin-like protein